VALFVGTSGWAYPEWKGAFYPEGMPQSRFLEHYSRELTGCEINATFHRVQTPSTTARWAASVPAPFRFAVKAHRALTYRKRIVLDQAGEEILGRFLESLEPLRERLGCLLLQLPPYVERDDEALEALVTALPAGVPVACELHHSSWNGNEVRERLASRGGTVCLREESGEVPAELPPGPIAYVRLKADRYSEPARAGWLRLLRTEAQSRDVYAFTKHKGIPPDDPYGGVGLARWLVNAPDP
jgi:uncharacterized protein YecE (DUF72 family)